ncbi:hypothetical protein DM02DRAFT_19512 [Periconia macrospinosa]|uniref:Uncharacterized protein n=1 Tax=Periconia macrospinosa TaxID=97972 RepID=A0A2V1CXI8_9PLEO|nr:hypothetical protein DM02DRAFT_19512 [Periconia macrospinosa]
MALPCLSKTWQRRVSLTAAGAARATSLNSSLPPTAFSSRLPVFLKAKVTPSSAAGWLRTTRISSTAAFLNEGSQTMVDTSLCCRNVHSPLPRSERLVSRLAPRLAWMACPCLLSNLQRISLFFAFLPTRILAVSIGKDRARPDLNSLVAEGYGDSALPARSALGERRRRAGAGDSSKEESCGTHLGECCYEVGSSNHVTASQHSPSAPQSSPINQFRQCSSPKSLLKFMKASFGSAFVSPSAIWRSVGVYCTSTSPFICASLTK